jgi:hypothetical protein
LVLDVAFYIFYVKERQNKVQKKKTDRFSSFTCGELSLL